MPARLTIYKGQERRQKLSKRTSLYSTMGESPESSRVWEVHKRNLADGCVRSREGGLVKNGD